MHIGKSCTEGQMVASIEVLTVAVASEGVDQFFGQRDRAREMSLPSKRMS